METCFAAMSTYNLHVDSPPQKHFCRLILFGGPYRISILSQNISGQMFINSPMGSSAVKINTTTSGRSKATVRTISSPHLQSSGLQHSTASWFRFLVKQVAVRGSVHRQEYAWYEMAFFTRWSSCGGNIAFCFNVPQALQERLRTRLVSASTKAKLWHIYSIHSLIVDEIVWLYDRAVWSLRDGVRELEMVIQVAIRKER